MKKTVFSIVFSISIVSFLIGIYMYKNGYQLNLTSSYPLGLYKTYVDHTEYKKNEMVLFCPPEKEIFKKAKELGYLRTGICPGGYIKMIKKIAAVPGDKIQIKNYVYVNDKVQKNSKVFFMDSKGNKLPTINNSFVLKKDEYLLLSDYSNRSFDARYFGAIKKVQIESKIKPIIIFN